MRIIAVSAAVLITLSLVALGHPSAAAALGTLPAAAQTPADRERARIQSRLGWESMRAEHWEEAARAFSKAIEIDPTYEYGYYSVGRAFLAMREYDEAIAALSKCSALYRAQSGRQFSNVQEAQRYRRDRVIEVNDIIRQLQQGPQSQRVLDQIRQLQNYLRDVQESIQRNIGISVENAVPAYVSLSLGSAYFRARKLADAEREYKATIAADPKSGEAHNNLAVVYLETERYAEAEASLQAAKRAGFKVHPDLEREIRDRRKRE